MLTTINLRINRSPPEYPGLFSNYSGNNRKTTSRIIQRRIQMSVKNIFTILSALLVFVFVLVLYPSMNQSVYAEQTKFSGSKNQLTPLHGATTLTKIYRIPIESTALLVQYFGKPAIEKALLQPGSVSVHVYYGKDQDGNTGYLIFGVDNRGNETLAAIPPLCPNCR
jgi:hypothetical protein